MLVVEVKSQVGHSPKVKEGSVKKSAKITVLKCFSLSTRLNNDNHLTTRTGNRWVDRP